jgi:hypothetical protein
VHLEERLLQQILGQAAVAHQADEIAQDLGGQEGVELVEGRRFPVAVATHQAGVLFVPHDRIGSKPALALLATSQIKSRRA